MKYGILVILNIVRKLTTGSNNSHIKAQLFAIAVSWFQVPLHGLEPKVTTGVFIYRRYCY